MKYINNKLVVAAFAAGTLGVTSAQALEAQLPPAGAEFEVIESTMADLSPMTTFALAGNPEQTLTVDQLMGLPGGLLIDTADPAAPLIVYSKDKLVSGHESFESIKSEIENASWFKERYPRRSERNDAMEDVQQALDVVKSKYAIGSMQASVAPELEVPFDSLDERVEAFRAFSEGEGVHHVDYAMYSSDVVDMVKDKFAAFAPPGYRDKVMAYTPMFTGVHEIEHLGKINHQDKADTYAKNFSIENSDSTEIVKHAVFTEVNSDLIGLMAVKKAMLNNGESPDVFNAFVDATVGVRTSEHLKESRELDSKLFADGRLRMYSRVDDDGVNYDRAKRDQRVNIFMNREHHVSDIPLKATALLLNDNEAAFSGMSWEEMREMSANISKSFSESPEMTKMIRRAGSSITASMDIPEKEMLATTLYHRAGEAFDLSHENSVTFPKMDLQGSKHNTFLKENGFGDTLAPLTQAGNAATYYSDAEGVLPHALSTVYPNDLKAAEIVFAIESDAPNASKFAYGNLDGIKMEPDPLNGQYLFKIELDENDPAGQIQALKANMEGWGVSPSVIKPSREVVSLVPALSEAPDGLRMNDPERVAGLMQSLFPDYGGEVAAKVMDYDFDFERPKLRR